MKKPILFYSLKVAYQRRNIYYFFDTTKIFFYDSLDWIGFQCIRFNPFFNVIYRICCFYYKCYGVLFNLFDI